MVVKAIMERFEKQAPITVMVRGALEHALAPEFLDALFQQHAEQQSNKELLFSTVCEIMTLVACKIRPSVHAAYQAQAEDIAVTVKAVYDKLQRMETDVSRQFVWQTADRLQQVVQSLGATLRSPLKGFHVKILDGNHLRRTERRIKALREINGAPLPGHCLVVLDQQTRLVTDVFPCEDGHAQERSLLPQVLETVQRKDLWIDDRNFCTGDFLFGIMTRNAYYITRQHASSPRCELLGKRRRVGRCETGTIYEQPVRIFRSDGHSAVVRRITLKLDQPTRDGDQEIHLLTNLPKRVAATKIVELYRQRWTIEVAFADVAKNLQGEIKTLGYPRAALFSFCTALVSYNVLQVVLAALRAAHGTETIDETVSIYYLADEVAHTHRGLAIAVPAKYWEREYGSRTPRQIARALLRIAQTVNLSRYLKHKRGPKKKTKPLNKRRRNHVSTARILAAARG